MIRSRKGASSEVVSRRERTTSGTAAAAENGKLVALSALAAVAADEDAIAKESEFPGSKPVSQPLTQREHANPGYEDPGQKGQEHSLPPLHCLSLSFQAESGLSREPLVISLPKSAKPKFEHCFFVHFFFVKYLHFLRFLALTKAPPLPAPENSRNNHILQTRNERGFLCSPFLCITSSFLRICGAHNWPPLASTRNLKK